MSKLLIIYSPYSKAAEFVLNGVQISNVDVVPLITRKQKIFKYIYFLFYILRLYKISSYFRYSKETRIALKKKYDKILCFDCCRLKEYKLINVFINTERKYLFFWNPLSYWCNDNIKLRKYLSDLQNQGFTLSTFDPRDAKEYDLELKKNINRKLYDNVNVDEKYDFYFIGKPKGRLSTITKLESFLCKNGFSVNFIIVRSAKDYVSLIENVKFSTEAKCIVDITADGQSGFTLRPFDALFYKKKILTNNKLIINADFYNKNNIYVFDENNMDGIVDFMAKEYREIPEQIINQYEVNHWVLYNFL